MTTPEQTRYGTMTGSLDRLHPVIVHYLANSLGWKELRRLQDHATGPLLDGQDALLLAGLGPAKPASLPGSAR